VSSENAAHRIAVEWNEGGVGREGVYIPRRDTSSRLNTVLGGRLFPGVHHRARFDLVEGAGRYQLHMRSDDGSAEVRIDAAIASAFPAGSVFGSLATASSFFERGALGYSATGREGTFDGLELRSLSWRLEPLTMSQVNSSFFEDRRLFLPGSVQFDCALLMRDTAHEWRAHDQLCVGAAPAA
jgi:hypothetical protein